MYESCYYITERKPEDAHLKNATNKARADVEATLRELGMREVKIAIAFQGDNASIAASLKEHWNTYRIWKKELAHLTRGDTLVVQVPAISHCIFLGKLVRELRQSGVRVILLIHDLEKLRFVEADDVPFKTRVRQRLDESSLLKAADLIIAHNDIMIDYLVGEGIPRERLVSLEIFDYRMPEGFSVHRPWETVDESNLDAPGADLIIAGNLDSDKVGYLKDIGRVPGVRFQLYGVGYKDSSENAVYNGSFLPDELPAYLHGNFGLVWDGTSIDTCTGIFGNYLRLNDPHKLSLYLTAGLPVIVWDEAAVADFVKEHHVGLTVASLSDIPGKLSGLSRDEYFTMARNAADLSGLLRDGHFLKTALGA